MSAVKDVVSLYQKLKVEWSKKPQNLQACGELLTTLKVSSRNDLTILCDVQLIDIEGLCRLRLC